MKHIKVHRPVICEVCKAEQSQYPGPQGWFRCLICGHSWR